LLGIKSILQSFKGNLILKKKQRQRKIKNILQMVSADKEEDDYGQEGEDAMISTPSLILK